MSWPTQTWTADGWKDFKTPGPSANPVGFEDDWKGYWDYEDSIGEDGEYIPNDLTYLGAMENPLYEAAAFALGMEDDWANLQGIFAEQQIRVLEDGEYEGEKNPRSVIDSLISDGHIDAGDERYIIQQIGTMNEYLGQTIKTHALQDAPIISRGPEGSDYNIDGDIWEHYNLDKPPAPPKPMDVDYDFKYIKAEPSSKTYDTPKDYPTLDTSTDSKPYEDTHYAEWLEDKYGDTSYGEPTTALEVTEVHDNNNGD